MRYTEDKNDNEVNDLIDLIRVVFSSIILSPYRLINEVSKKIMYLNKSLIEKILLVSVLINTGMIIWDAIIFLIFRRASLLDGALPLIPKMMSLVILAVISVLAGRNLRDNKMLEVSEEVDMKDLERSDRVEEWDSLNSEEEEEERKDFSYLNNEEEEDSEEDQEDLRSLSDLIDTTEYESLDPLKDDSNELIDLSFGLEDNLHREEKLDNEEDSDFSEYEEIDSGNEEKEFVSKIIGGESFLESKTLEDLFYDIDNGTKTRILEEDEY